jgi:hypothetical protein
LKRLQLIQQRPRRHISESSSGSRTPALARGRRHPTYSKRLRKLAEEITAADAFLLHCGVGWNCSHTL